MSFRKSNFCLQYFPGSHIDGNCFIYIPVKNNLTLIQNDTTVAQSAYRIHIMADV